MICCNGVRAEVSEVMDVLDGCAIIELDQSLSRILELQVPLGR